MPTTVDACAPEIVAYPAHGQQPLVYSRDEVGLNVARHNSALSAFSLGNTLLKPLTRGRALAPRISIGFWGRTFGIANIGIHSGIYLP